jgi:hypothetical protein
MFLVIYRYLDEKQNTFVFRVVHQIPTGASALFSDAREFLEFLLYAE